MIDKRQRNRCQYCGYQKCLAMGMKQEAVQEERQRGKDENEVESTSSANEDMPVERILEAELAVEPKTETYVEANVGLNPSWPNHPFTNICQAADKQLFTLVEWAMRIPHFSELPLDDQVILLQAGLPSFCSACRLCAPLGSSAWNISSSSSSLGTSHQHLPHGDAGSPTPNDSPAGPSFEPVGSGHPTWMQLLFSACALSLPFSGWPLWTLGHSLQLLCLRDVLSPPYFCYYLSVAQGCGFPEAAA
ncbi:retinoic acid receptor RXR-alpha-like [Cebus imitator]|uniref:retinoic acid receptor RXR-alpha-like n=1 Tax=Cebus imitator TaxID=2715852 RepID=UPI00189B625D|nr:retinoic acid receptor RXR-alpha-like [Cebus imitator]